MKGRARRSDHGILIGTAILKHAEDIEAAKGKACKPRNGDIETSPHAPHRIEAILGEGETERQRNQDQRRFIHQPRRDDERGDEQAKAEARKAFSPLCDRIESAGQKEQGKTHFDMEAAKGELQRIGGIEHAHRPKPESQRQRARQTKADRGQRRAFDEEARDHQPVPR